MGIITLIVFCWTLTFLHTRGAPVVLNLHVVNSEGTGIENANVYMRNASGLQVNVATNSTGYIAEQTFDSGNYTLTIRGGGYTTYNHTYSWTDSYSLIVAMAPSEDEGPGIIPIALGFVGLVVFLAYAYYK